MSKELKSAKIEYEALFVSNVFTPNGDQINDYFFIRNLIPGSLREVYNRFGKLIYRNNQYQNKWGAEDAGPGVYYYMLRNAHPCAQPKVAKGWAQMLS